ncbi:hypothetical protein RFI_18015, partial [Reticulomyxa filosa]
MLSMSNLVKLNCKSEVTALKFIEHGRFLVAGEGSYLTFFDASTGRYLSQHRILSRNKIHVIECFPVNFPSTNNQNENNASEYQIIICGGGREFQIVFRLLKAPVIVNDWILDCTLLEKETMAIYDLQLKYGATAITAALKYQCTISNDHNCMLYCLKFFGSKRSNLRVVAGDLFEINQVSTELDDRITSTNKKRNDTENKSKVMFCADRKGTIFSVAWSKDGKYFAYASDDRT